MSDADIAEVRESASLFSTVEETTADLRGLLDFFCGWRWLTAGMKKKEQGSFSRHRWSHNARPAVGACLQTVGARPRAPRRRYAWFQRCRMDDLLRAVARGPDPCRPGRLSALGGSFSGGVATLAAYPSRGRLRRDYRKSAVGPHQAAGSGVVRYARALNSLWLRRRRRAAKASGSCAKRDRL